MHRTRREMDERAEQRTRDERFPGHRPALTTDGVTNALNALRHEIADIRTELDDMARGLDQSDVETDITGITARLDELEAAVGA